MQNKIKKNKLRRHLIKENKTLNKLSEVAKMPFIL